MAIVRFVNLVFGTGYGIGCPSLGGFYRWNKHSFWPTSNIAAGNTWDYFANPPSSWDEYGEIYIYTATNTFNLAGFQQGNEAVIGIWVNEVEVDTYTTHTWTFSFEDPEGTVFQSNGDSGGIDTGSYRLFTWMGTGVKYFNCPYGPEIWCNGTYKLKYSITFTPGGTYSNEYSFVVSNYPTATLIADYANIGMIWIYGENLYYISYMGCRHYINHDGNTYGFAGVSNSGHIWVHNTEHGRLYWVDQSGYVRRSKKGDRFGFGGAVTPDVPDTPGAGNAGHIWQCGYPEWTNIVAVGADGYSYRYGPMSLHNDYF